MSKTCTKCKTAKPAEAFRPDTRYRDGLGSWCRECMAQRKRQHRDEERAWKEANGIPTTKGIDVPWRGRTIRVGVYKVVRFPEGWYRKCVDCGLQPIDDFNKQGKGLRSQCRSCEREYRAQWRDDNRENLREYGRRRREAARQREQVLQERIHVLEQQLRRASMEA